MSCNSICVENNFKETILQCYLKYRHHLTSTLIVGSIFKYKSHQANKVPKSLKLDYFYCIDSRNSTLQLEIIEFSN